MTWVLPAAILCGALWVCCNTFILRRMPPSTQATVTANTPPVTANTPSVTANTPSVTADTPSVTSDTPSVTADTPSVTADTPSVTADTPSVTADKPSETTRKPSETTDRPSVTTDTPSVTTDTPSVTTYTPSVTANTPSVTASTPTTAAETSAVSSDTLIFTITTPLVTANTPSETADKPSITADKPLVTADTPRITADNSSLTADTPSVTASTPFVTAETTSFSADTSPTTVTTLSVTADTPSVTASTPFITAETTSFSADTPPTTVTTPPVTADTPQVTANTLSETEDTPAVTSDTPWGTVDMFLITTVNTSIHIFEQRRGLKTYMEGDRIVFEVTADFLWDCVEGKSQEDMNKDMQQKDDFMYVAANAIVLNDQIGLHSIRRGTLKIDFRSDTNMTLTPGTEGLTMQCPIKIRMQRSGLFYVWKLFKVLLFEQSLENRPEDVCRVEIIGYEPLYYTKGLERPEMAPLLDELYVMVHWKGLPEAVTMEMEYTILYEPGPKRKPQYQPLDWRVSYTSPVTGFLRTAFWDGTTAYRGLDGIFIAKGGMWSGTVTVPKGYSHTMVSWQDVGVGDSTTCNTLYALLSDGAPFSLDSSSTHMMMCGGAHPAPVLVDWRHIQAAMHMVVASEGTNIVNTGVSMRFSFHDDSNGLLPQQLENNTWDCSVAHWPDFRQHLLCDLVTQCAGGEDEADCSYTGDGTTCRHGYLAAGGSCFTFEPAAAALDPRAIRWSWAEAQTACRSRDARLPTMNTPAKWRAVLDLLTHAGWDTIYIGLTPGTNLPDLYSGFLQWADRSVAYYLKAKTIPGSRCGMCAFLKKTGRPGFLYLDSCLTRVHGSLLCESVEVPSNTGAITFATENTPHRGINSIRCPKGHVTHNFLSCDPRSDCLHLCYATVSAPGTIFPPAFLCHNGFERVPFTLLCDHREDCSDASDEICVFPPCTEFECNSKQCIAQDKTCDGVKDCLDGSDETVCSKGFTEKLSTLNYSTPLPAMVLHDGKGLFKLLDMASSDNRSTMEGCPDSHFKCPGVSYYCLPVYVRCNGVRDCPGHQDEAECENSGCPGFYRCRGSTVCLHSDHVCDGVSQCPQRDDELLCGFGCPVGCTCYGLAYFCEVPFDASSNTSLRFLDASGSGMRLKGLSNNTMLFYLNLGRSEVRQLETMNFVNVFHLDLSENYITTLADEHIRLLKNLQVFILTGNPLREILEDSSPYSQDGPFTKLHTLDVSAVSVTAAQISNLHMFSNVTTLNLSNTGLDAVSGLSVFSKLQVLDLRGCPVTYFARSVFQGLDDLSTVYADNYKLCCPETLPDGFNVFKCHAPFDEVSSCEGLLKSGLYRVGLSVLTTLIILGNASSFVYRVFINRPQQQSTFGFFVTNLCLSDFLMGVYSAIIGVADQLYLGNYLWNDVKWRRSVPCKMAGVLSLISNEVSILIICLITVDRFLVTRFPFSVHLHFSPNFARFSCITIWIIGVLLAITPLLPAMSHWQLYSQTGICIPLPVTRRWFAGRDYSFGILIILNFALFLVIASGQMFIYLSIRANSMATSDTTQKAKDLTIARRLITVAVSNFLCWFPVGLLGMLSSRGHPIPGEASVVIAVFVLPLNSALNPFLYTVNVILERRQRAREQRLKKIILASYGVATAKRDGEGHK